MQKTISKIKQNGNYSPKIFFTDGSKVELHNYSTFPSWLAAGITIKFDVRPGKFPDCPEIIPLEIIQQPVVESIPIPNPIIIPEPVENKNIPLNYQRESADIWLKKQKQIAIQSALERTTELICAGKLSLSALQPQVLKIFNLILQYSGIEKQEQKEKSPSHKKIKKNKRAKQLTPDGNPPESLVPGEELPFNK